MENICTVYYGISDLNEGDLEKVAGEGEIVGIAITTHTDNIEEIFLVPKLVLNIINLLPDQEKERILLELSRGDKELLLLRHQLTTILSQFNNQIYVGEGERII